MTQTTAQSQIPEWKWARSGFGQGSAVCSALDESCNLYISGSYYSPLSFDTCFLNDNINNGFQAYVTKFDSSGSALWAKSARGNLASGNVICTDKNGSLYLAGVYFGDSISFDQITLRNNITADPNYFIAKYDSSGTVLWAKAIGCGPLPNPSGLISDINNNIYFSGGFSSPLIIFGGDTLNNSGSRNSFVTKYDQSGNEIWARKIGGTSTDWISGLTSDGSGNIYVTGYFKSPTLYFDSDSLVNSGGMDFFLAKYDASGNFIWAKSSVGDFDEFPRSITGNSSGIYISGTSTSKQVSFDSVILNDTSSNPSHKVMFLCNYDTNGNVIWAKNLPAYNAIPYSMAIKSDNDIVITGHIDTAATMIDTLIVHALPGSFDPMFIAEFSNSGKIKWAKTLASGGDYFSSVAIYRDENIFITGYFATNPFIVGNDTMNLLSWECPFVAKLFAPSRTTVIDNLCSSIIYPNPFTNELNIRTEEGKSEISLYDILSHKFITTEFDTEINISLNNIPKGVYIYELHCSGGNIKRGKIVKQ